MQEDIKAIRATVEAIRVDVAVNTTDLKHHIARSDAADLRISRLELVFIVLAGTAVLGGLAKLLIS